MADVPDVRALLLASLASLQDCRVALALSGGIDSTVLGLTLTEAGHEVTAFSFRLADRQPGDWLRAQATAATLGWPFIDVSLPTDPSQLETDVRALVARGLRKKTAIECAWPMMYLLDAVRAGRLTTLVTGSCADGHFGVSKRAMLHCRATVEDLDAFRRGLFNNPDYAQVGDAAGARSRARPRRARAVSV